MTLVLQANITGQDVFVLPPSGHTYSYPGMMPDDMQVPIAFSQLSP